MVGCLKKKGSLAAGTNPAPVFSARWRSALSVFSWLLIIQSGLGFLLGLFSLAILKSFRAEDLVGRLGMLVETVDLTTIEKFLVHLQGLQLAQIGLNGLVVVGAVGLWKRKKWGWYLTTIRYGLEVPAILLGGSAALRPVLRLLSPSQADLLSLVIAFLLALVPASITGFLMLRPIVIQFEKQIED